MTATVDHARLQRTRLIRAIKAAERKLGMDEDAHRLLVFQLVGKRSLTECDLGRLKTLRAHLNAKTGGHPGKPKAARPGAGDLLAKIEAQLADMQLPWSYAQAILRRVSACKALGEPGTERFEWARPEHLHKVVAALAYEQEKRAVSESVKSALIERNFARHDLPFICAEAGVSWRADWERKPSIARIYLQLVLARPLRMADGNG